MQCWPKIEEKSYLISGLKLVRVRNTLTHTTQTKKFVLDVQQKLVIEKGPVTKEGALTSKSQKPHGMYQYYGLHMKVSKGKIIAYLVAYLCMYVLCNASKT